MEGNKIKALLIKDIKLVDVRKLMIFLSLAIIYYYVFPNLLQYNAQGDVYLFGVGYQPLEIVQKSLIGLSSSFMFMAGITVIEFNENQALGFSFVAARIRVRYMIITRALFGLGWIVISEFVALVYFVGIIKLPFFLVFMISINMMTFSLFSHLLLSFFFEKKKADVALAILIFTAAMYSPFFLTGNQILFANIIFAIISVFLMIVFCEKNYRNKLLEEVSGSKGILSQNDMIRYEIERKLRDGANKIYLIMERIIGNRYIQQQSLLLTDLHRNFMAMKKIVPLLAVAFLFKDNLVVRILIIALLLQSLIRCVIRNCREDYWVCQVGLVNPAIFWKSKGVVAAVFNIFIVCVLNFALSGIMLEIFFQGLSATVLIVTIGLLFSWISIKRKMR